MSISAITYTTINENFPVAGQDNDSQGFRDNFARIKTALGTAQTEITYLNSNAVDKTINNDMGNNTLSNVILKNSGIDELVKAVLTIVEGEDYYSNEVSQILLKGTIKKTKKSLEERNEILSQREKQILGMIVRELTSKEIGDELCLSSRTVEGHRNNIMEKLNIKSTIGLVKYAMQNNIE